MNALVYVIPHLSMQPSQLYLCNIKKERKNNIEIPHCKINFPRMWHVAGVSERDTRRAAHMLWPLLNKELNILRKNEQNWHSINSTDTYTARRLLAVFRLSPPIEETPSNFVFTAKILSVCLSVTRVLCDDTKEHIAEILTPHEKVSNLVFRYQKRLVGDVPFHPWFALKETHHPFLKNADFDQ